MGVSIRRVANMSSLLSTVCCSAHVHNACLVWNEIVKSIEVWTYGELRERVTAVTRQLRLVIQHLQTAETTALLVGIYTSYINNDYITAILSVLSIPAVFTPLDPITQSNQHLKNLQFILVHIDVLKEFLSNAWVQQHCDMINTSIIHYGYIIVTMTPYSPSSAVVSSLPSTVPSLSAVPSPSPSSTVPSSSTIPSSFAAPPSTAVHSPSPTKQYICYSCSKQNTTPLFQTPPINPHSLAYVLHTSGTTGTARLVRVPHCCILPNILDLCKRLGVESHDRVFNAAPMTFDPSIVEVFLALCSGATLVMVPTTIKMAPSLLAKVLFHHCQVTVLQATPSLIYRLPDYELLLGDKSCVKVLAFGGEDCPSLQWISNHKTDDNMTKVFNLYGITEVSCWATCEMVTNDKLREHSIHDEDSVSRAVSLGQPLAGTVTELRNNDGVITRSGYGHIWIGGTDRVCMIDDEECIVPGTMRDSGDYGYISPTSGKLYYIGRTDRQIKRHGIRVNLDNIQQIISSSSLVSSVAVSSSSSSDAALLPLLVAVIVPSSSAMYNVHSLYRELSAMLPSAAVPDKILIVDQLPINSHGKLDVKQLSITNRVSSPSLLSRESLLSLIISSASDVLNISWQLDDDSSTLSSLGASSFDVLRLLNVICDQLPQASTNLIIAGGLYEALLTQPLHKIVTIFNDVLENEDKSNVQETVNKTIPVEQLANKPMDHTTVPNIRSWRRGQTMENGRIQYPVISDCSIQHCNLEVKWSVPTGQCVDASPLVVESTDGTQCVYVGSHSGLFLAILVDNGDVLWQTKLGGRIESSACVSLDGKYVSVGCYDGCVYTMSVSNGSIYWAWCNSSSDDVEPIKSSPVCDPSSGLVWVGSHDQHLYALDVERKTVAHRVFAGGGSCFSSPCVLSNCPLVCIATLRGNICGVNTRTGVVNWIYTCPKPLFSSPNVLPDGRIACGCTDNNIYILSHQGQCMVQSCLLSTYGPVFSSCSTVVTNLSNTFPYLVFCSSHDHHVYCWSLMEGREPQLIWRTKLDSEVYSIPHVGPAGIVCACSSAGWLYVMDAMRGTVLGHLELPWDIFSSPVLLPSGLIVVGCRNDHVYCISIEVI